MPARGMQGERPVNLEPPAIDSAGWPVRKSAAAGTSSGILGTSIMKTRTLGSSGLRVSEIGIGCNNFSARLDLEGTRAVVDSAIELGITLFDTADVYGGTGSETFLGKLLGARRKEIVLATKFSMPVSAEARMRGASRHYIMHAVEASLTRLNTDWIDLYQVHQPDPQTPIEETLRALDDLIRQGKVRYIGLSNFSAWSVVDAQWTARHLGLNRLISCQDQYSMLERDIEKDLVPAMRAQGLGLLPYYPLAGGFLSGKYRRNAPPPSDTRLGKRPEFAKRYLTEAYWNRLDRLAAFAEARGHTLLELAFAWLLAQDVIASVIAGASKPEQLAANVKAAEWRLGADELTEVEKLLAD